MGKFPSPFYTLRQTENHKVPDSFAMITSLSVLSFNFRSLDLRLQEVIFLAIAVHFDIIILLETGTFDMSFCRATFSNYRIFAQKGETHTDVV